MKHVVEWRSLGPFPVKPIGFGAMRLTGPNGFGPPRDRREAVRVLREVIALGVTPAQVVLAWALELAQNVLLIPGASSVDHLRENLAAAAVRLDPDAIDRLSAM